MVGRIRHPTVARCTDETRARSGRQALIRHLHLQAQNSKSVRIEDRVGRIRPTSVPSRMATRRRMAATIHDGRRTNDFSTSLLRFEEIAGGPGGEEEGTGRPRVRHAFQRGRDLAKSREAGNLLARSWSRVGGRCLHLGKEKIILRRGVIICVLCIRRPKRRLACAKRIAQGAAHDQPPRRHSHYVIPGVAAGASE